MGDLKVRIRFMLDTGIKLACQGGGVLVLVIVLLLGGVCVGGWRFSKRRKHFEYDKLDAEMAALRHAIEQQGEPSVKVD